MSYTNEQVSRVLDDAYHARQQRGALTPAVTTKFGNSESSKGVTKLLTALTDDLHADHIEAVDALNELLS